MTSSMLERLRADVDALGVAFAGARAAFGASEGVDELSAFSGRGLVQVVAAAARMRRGLDALIVRAGDEVARRSAPEFGADGLSKQHGFSSPARLLASARGGAQSAASRLLAVGEATRERSSFAGERLPSKFEHVRAALDRAAISVDAAAAITGMLRRVELRADPNLLGPYERKLVEVAETEPLSLLMRAVTLAEARLDADGAAPADERLFTDRSLTFHEDGAGVFHLRGRLDPVTAAPVKAALDALVGDALRRRREAPAGDATDPAGPPAVIGDRRSIPQLQADALSELAAHALGCTSAPGSAPKTTVVVRMSLDALRHGDGFAEIDGIDRPIAATTARKLAVDAEFVPLVLGGANEPLDLGQGRRLFSRAQRLALMERDGGCASCGANITYAEAHHIDWWSRGGATDLGNGVMLCTHCHHQVHDHGWGIRVDGAHVWFIPPPHVDPSQRPRLGGRARFDPTSAERVGGPPGHVGSPLERVGFPPEHADSPLTRGAPPDSVAQPHRTGALQCAAR